MAERKEERAALLRAEVQAGIWAASHRGICEGSVKHGVRHVDALLAVLAALRRSPVDQVSGEPVAWEARTIGGNTVHFFNSQQHNAKAFERAGYVVRALVYAKPLPANGGATAPEEEG